MLSQRRITADPMLKNIYLTLRIALFYVIFGQLGFLLALLPDTNITLIWPPAGIALAAVLLRGNLALPGIFLGAATTSLIEIQSISPLIMLSAVAVTSTATTLAALIAAKFLRRYAPSAPIWGSAADLLIGSMGMGLACTLPAFFGVGCLYVFGLLPVGAIATSLSMWWLGEFCGMVIFAPLAFVVGHRISRRVWHLSKPSKILRPTALNSAVAAMALASFLALWTLDGAKISQSLEREATIAANSLTAALHTASRDLESIRALLYAYDRIDKDEFLRYTTAEFGQQFEYSEAVAVGWAPKVANPKAWELEMLSMGERGVTLFERDDSGEKIAVTKRADYFPVHLIHPPDDINRKAIGFDLGSEKLRRQALDRARDSGLTSIMAPIFLVQSEEQVPAMLICSAIYRPGAMLETVTDRRANLIGFASGVYQIGSIFDRALSGINADIAFHLLDESRPEGEQWYHTKASPFRAEPEAVLPVPGLASLNNGFNGIASVNFANHQWLVVATPGANYIKEQRTWTPWGALSLLLALGIVMSSIMIERILAQKRIDTERLKTETALHEARAANESKSYFMAAASHDIKQPLYALGILTDTLLMTNPPENTIPIVKSLSKSIKEMSLHFDTLMDVGRFQDGSFKVTQTSVSLNDLARRIDMEIAPLCSEKDLGWNLDVDDVLVHTDAELLLRLIRNLLINAVRYTANGEVGFSAKSRGKVVCFEIFDTGEGLSPDQQKLVFSEIVRLRGNEIHTTGHGLGLSIVNKVSEALDLELQVSSSEEKGTRFIFYCRTETLALNQADDFTVDTRLR